MQHRPRSKIFSSTKKTEIQWHHPRLTHKPKKTQPTIVKPNMKPNNKLNSHAPRALLLTVLLGLAIPLACPSFAQQPELPNAFQSFLVGNGPVGVACDQANVWVVNST